MSDQKKDVENIEFEAEEIVGKVKELVKKGNIARITVKKGSETIVSLPVNAGVIGTAMPPGRCWAQPSPPLDWTAQ